MNMNNTAALVISKILELAGVDDILITPTSNVYVMKGEDTQFLFFIPHSSMRSGYIGESMAPSIQVMKDTSWIDLSEEQQTFLVLESLCGSFFSPPKSHHENKVVFIPPANDVAELGVKLDMLDSIFVDYDWLNHFEGHSPNWLLENL